MPSIPRSTDCPFSPPVDDRCPLCRKTLVHARGRYGPYLKCPNRRCKYRYWESEPEKPEPKPLVAIKREEPEPITEKKCTNCQLLDTEKCDHGGMGVCKSWLGKYEVVGAKEAKETKDRQNNHKKRSRDECTTQAPIDGCCPLCHRKVVQKSGSRGLYWSCPVCHYTHWTNE